MQYLRHTLSFSDVSIGDVPRVGGKNASLGEMIRALSPKGIRIPGGFIVTAEAYRYFIKENGLEPFIKKTLGSAKGRSVALLAQQGKAIRAALVKAPLPKDLAEEIRARYAGMEKAYGKRADVAVRSSATAEDVPEASFAGQHETYLNVRGAEAVCNAVRAAFASLFTNRAISYREDKGFGHLDVALSVGVQKMVRSDRGSSGVAFTLETESGFKDAVIINGAWGLGELIVQGEIIPDEWMVFKPTKAIIDKRLGKKDKKMVYSASAGKTIKLEKTTPKEQETFVLSEDEVVKLAEWCVAIEKHYSEKNGHWTPMDVEWAKDGVSGDMYIVQARPETVHARRDKRLVKAYRLITCNRELVTGTLLKGAAIGSMIAAGKARVILDAKDIGKFKAGEILVTDMTDPDWEPIMKIAAAIVTDKGGRTSHAAIVSRELGIPAIVGTGSATRKIKTGDMVTVDTTGSEGVVYKGKLKFEVEEHEVAAGNRELVTGTKVMMNIATPDTAFEKSFIPNDGVGLAREEFIIASEIGIHPNALIEYGTRNLRLVPRVRKEIEKRTVGWKDKERFYVDKLAYGIGKIAAAFYPKEVIVRFSDFKTNEYRSLVGGELYEPEEANPMLGWRGASRYYDERFAAAFGLECRAMKKVRDEMGLTNVVPMVPFCRTPEEGKKVVALMEKHGLRREHSREMSGFQDSHDKRASAETLKNLKVFVMCEIPSNVLRADEFLDVFDGMSIGSNDLTQLVLGIDRDSELVAKVGDERDEAVKKLIRDVIGACRKRGKYVGICGDAPSTFPEFKKFLIAEGIESISLNPDALLADMI